MLFIANETFHIRIDDPIAQAKTQLLARNLNNLELVGIGEVVQGESGGSGKGSKAGSSKEVSLDLILGGSRFDLHLGLNGPDVGLSVLIDGNSSLDSGTVFLRK